MARTTLVLLVLVLVGCTASDPDAGGSDASEPAPTERPAASSSPSPSEGPMSEGPTSESPVTEAPTGTASEDPGAADTGAVDSQLAFVLGVLDGAEVDRETYDERFAQVFTDQLPFEQFAATLDQVTALAPFTLGEERSRDGSGLVVEATASDGTELVITLHVDAEGRIDGLLLSPGEPPTLDEPVTSLQDAVDRLAAMGQLHLAASTVEGTTCTTDVGVAADQPAPIGSAFKLYVLAAVVDAVDAGELAWTDSVELAESDKSLPSGVLQDRPAGSPVSIAEAAELMISISDNTATDLLIRAVGRDAVEAAQAAYGHADPSLNTPFPTTRELFVLKAADPEVQQAWVDGDETTRRAVLDDLAGEPLPPVTTFTGDPVRPAEIEWFASPEDLCRVLAALHVRFDDPGMAPLRGILTTNPGIPDEEGRWEEILFKGGSEPGVVAGAFLVTGAEGGTYALTASVLDPAAPLDEIEAVLLMGAARDQLPAG
ncbi:serine hydrolase [Euzebya sp.]|uniref:serine hydrolase n=1 Tax=Euzebya sp. TaxID=1971409 RepID=UPI003519A2B8